MDYLLRGVYKQAEIPSSSGLEFPGSSQSMYVAKLQGVDAQSRLLAELARRGRLLVPSETLARATDGVAAYGQDRVRNSLAAQAESGPLRHLSDLSGDYGKALDLAAGFGNNPQQVQRVREAFDKSGMSEFLDKPNPEVAADPYRWHQVANMMQFLGQDYRVANHRWNRANRPTAYWLNPLDRTGPLIELGDRLARRQYAGTLRSTLPRSLATSLVPGLGLLLGGQNKQDRIRATMQELGVYDKTGPDKMPGAEELIAARKAYLAEYERNKRELEANGGVKQAGLVEDIAYHLPRIRGLDTAVGLGGGAAAGLGVAAVRDWLQGKPKEGEPDKSPSYLQHALAGATVGAAGSNLIGDRLRRYISNAVETGDYGSSQQLKDLTPGSLNRFLDLAVYDRKNHVRGLERPAVNSDAARELWRRGMGLPVDRPLFQEVRDNVYGYAPERLPDVKNLDVGFVLGRNAPEALGDGRVIRRDRYDFDLHPGEREGLADTVARAVKGEPTVDLDKMDTWYQLGGSKRSPVSQLRSIALRSVAQALLGPKGGVELELREQDGIPVSEFPKRSALITFDEKTAQSPDIAESAKTASTALVRRIIAGSLSPKSISRAAASMPSGRVRQVKQLGSGSFNLADLMVGNVGNKPGLVVRKLPLQQVPLLREHRLNQLASGRIEQMQPGAAAKYLPDDHRKGLFQEYGDRQVIPSWSPGDSAQTGKYFQNSQKPHVDAKQFYSNLTSKGVKDIRPSNLGPGGQLIDYQLPVGKRHRLVAGGTTGPKLEHVKALNDKLPAIVDSRLPRDFSYLPTRIQEQLRTSAQQFEKTVHMPSSRAYFNALDKKLPNFVRKYWLSGKPITGLEPTYARRNYQDLKPVAMSVSERLGTFWRKLQSQEGRQMLWRSLGSKRAALITFDEKTAQSPDIAEQPPTYQIPFPNFERLLEDSRYLQTINSEFRTAEDSSMAEDAILALRKRKWLERDAYLDRHGELLKQVLGDRYLNTYPSVKLLEGSQAESDDRYNVLRERVAQRRSEAELAHEQALTAYNNSKNQASQLQSQQQWLGDATLAGRNLRNSLMTTGVGALGGALLGNYLHRRLRKDKADGLERTLATTAGGLGGAAIGYGLAGYLQSRGKQAALITFDDLKKYEKLVAAGLAVQARDTGRVLLIQRAFDKKDPAGGMWEAPGGHIDEGESPLDGAIREFEEETGFKLPSGSLQATWNYGIYRGHVWSIARESMLDLHQPQGTGDRKVLNPDNPEQDYFEAIAWWKPELLIGNPSLRQELRASMHLVQRALDRDRHLQDKYADRLAAVKRRRDPDGLESKTASYLTQGIYTKVI